MGNSIRSYSRVDHVLILCSDAVSYLQGPVSILSCLCRGSVHVLVLSVWDSSMFSDFHPLLKNIPVSRLAMVKLPLGVNVCMCVCACA